MTTARILTLLCAMAVALSLAAGAAGERIYTDAEILGSVGAANQGELEASRLGMLNGTAFDRSYIDLQISDHQTLLRKIDEDRMPDAKNEPLRALLREIRPTVAYRLEMACRLQAQVGRPAQYRRRVSEG
jgi:predicted outer membrane protein